MNLLQPVNDVMEYLSHPPLIVVNLLNVGVSYNLPKLNWFPNSVVHYSGYSSPVICSSLQ